MAVFRVGKVPHEVVQADEARFNNWTLATALQASGPCVDGTVLNRYCHWFVGHDYGWKRTCGEDWSHGYEPDWAATLGDHLSGQTDQRLRKTHLHMLCKSGKVRDKPFHWTRFLGIDIDHQPGQATGFLRDRYDRCLEAIGCTPVVVRSPSSGLHLFFPLTEPVSTLGFVQSFHPELPLLVPAALAMTGITVRAGLVELLPTSKHTLRMPLAWGTVQLAPRTLEPLPNVPRDQEIARLVDSMDAATALDPFALAKATRLIQRRRSAPATPPEPSAIGIKTREPGRPDICPQTCIDVDRLEAEGLYSGVCRNEAAMALARRKMLRFSWDAEATVHFLLTWTATMTNGLSNTAAKLPCEATEELLTNEYHRICRGIQKGVAEGKVISRAGIGTGRPITDAEARWIFSWTTGNSEAGFRYRAEVFLFCCLGFAKDRGQLAIGPARLAGSALVHAQFSSRMMERWPFGSSGSYRRWLSWAEDTGFTRMVLNYRHSQETSRSRARAFEFEVEVDTASGIGVDPISLIVTAQRIRGPRGSTVHPRQVEHALYAWREFGESLIERYGESEGQFARRLVAEYKLSTHQRGSPDAVRGAA